MTAPYYGVFNGVPELQLIGVFFKVIDVYIVMKPHSLPVTSDDEVVFMWILLWCVSDFSAYAASLVISGYGIADKEDVSVIFIEDINASASVFELIQYVRVIELELTDPAGIFVKEA